MTTLQRTRTWLGWMAPVIILALAAFLRLHRLDLMEYKYDQIIAMMMGQDMVRGRTFYLHGLLSSVGVDNPGLFIWIVAAAAALHDSPVFVAGAIAALNVAGLAIFYLLFRRRWPEPVVLAALLLLAACPWAVAFSRCIWAQDLLPLFMAPFGYCLLKFLDERSTGHAVAAVVLLGLAAQIHLSALFIVPGMIVLLGVRRLLFHRGVWIGAGVVLLTLTPFFVYLAREWDRTVTLVRYGRTVKPPGDMAGLLTYCVALSGGLRMAEQQFGKLAQAFAVESSWAVAAMTAASVMVIALMGVGLIAALARRLPEPLGRDLRRAGVLIAGLWLGYWVLAVPSYPHYAIILYPWPFAFAAAGAWTLGRAAKGAAARGAIPLGLAGAAAAAFAVFTISYIGFVDRHKMSGTEYGAPYARIPLSMIGLAYSKEGRHDRAVEAYRRAVAAEPRNMSLVAALAFSTARSGDPRGAVALLERAIAARPLAKMLQRCLIILLATDPVVRDPPRALELALRMNREPPLQPADLYDLAIALDASGRRTEAIAELERLVLHSNMPADWPDRPGYERLLKSWKESASSRDR